MVLSIIDNFQPVDVQTGTTTLKQSGLGSNDNEKVVPYAPELELYHNM